MCDLVQSHIITEIKICITIYGKHLYLICFFIYTGHYNSITSHILIICHISGIYTQQSYISVIPKIRIHLRIYSYHIRIKLNTPYIIKSVLYNSKTRRYNPSYSQNQYENN